MQVSSLFDIIGPVMVGPSSSHTAGAVRLGLLGRSILGEEVRRARLTLHGSFAQTGKGHGTYQALTAGLLGRQVDDPALVNSLEEATAKGVEVTFAAADLGEVHPNTVLMELESVSRQVKVQGSSLGGGKVEINQIDSFPVTISGETPTLVVTHRDRPGAIAGVTAILSGGEINISAMRVSRKTRGELALMTIETDDPLLPGVVESISSLKLVEHSLKIEPVYKEAGQ